MTGYTTNMKKTLHPGFLIKIICLDRFGLSVTEAAKLLKAPRANFSSLINGHMSISPLMALRLEAVFNTDAKKWLELQLEHDLSLAKKRRLNLNRLSKKKIKVKWPA